MKKSSLNILLIVFALLLCSVTWLMAQTAQPQNSQQNAAPVHHGTDPNAANPNSVSPNNSPSGSPGNTGTGNKPVNGSAGTRNPNGNSKSPHPDSSKDTGSHGPARPVGPKPSRSPQ